MKMPPQKPIGNGYYGYEDITHVPDSGLESTTTESESDLADDIPPTNAENDFSEYLWMEHEEEFDKEVMQQLEEEELMEQCIEAMLEEENRNLTTEQNDRTSQQNPPDNTDGDIANLVENFRLNLVDVEKSTLNPLAAEFVPDTRDAEQPPPPDSE